MYLNVEKRNEPAGDDRARRAGMMWRIRCGDRGRMQLLYAAAAAAARIRVGLTFKLPVSFKLQYANRRVVRARARAPLKNTHTHARIIYMWERNNIYD